MRIIVCGSRDYNDRERVFSELDAIDEECGGIECVIDGQQTGADTLGNEWAIERGRAWERVPADWDRHGKAAGPIRNGEMILRKPDLVVAFPGGRGTANMIKTARLNSVKVMEIK